MGLVLYTKVSAPLRIENIYLIQCPENTFLAVDYAAVYHTDGPDVCAWEYALFPLEQSAPQGK